MNRGPHITIRRASAGDLPALARVWHDGWHHGHAHLSLEIAAGRPFEFFLPRIWLQCQVRNLRSRRFYEKHNWHVAREVDVTIGTMDGRKPQLVWRMEKSLSAFAHQIDEKNTGDR